MRQLQVPPLLLTPVSPQAIHPICFLRGIGGTNFFTGTGTTFGLGLGIKGILGTLVKVIEGGLKGVEPSMYYQR
jgi:hypothetical protein